MNNLLRQTLVFCIFSLTASTAFSQTYTVKGTIVTTQKQTVEFADVALLENENVLYETYTDSLGGFEFRVEQPQTYTLLLDYFGSVQLRKEINIAGDMDLGTIEIEGDGTLEELVISAQRRQIEKKVDRLVFNVAGSIQSSGSDALELLKVTPRVKVDNDQVSMIGKSGMKVMVDDRLVQLSGSDLTNFLRSLRSDDIESIEVITTPPAKYSAEGNSGLINIVTKTKKEEAWNAGINGLYRQGTHAFGLIGGNFNYRKNKLTLSANANYQNGSVAPVNSSTITYPTILWKENNHRKDIIKPFAGSIGVDYDISEKVSTGVNYRYNKNNYELLSTLTSNIINKATNATDSLIRTPGVQYMDTDLHVLNYHFIYKMDTLKRKLSFDFDYFNYNSVSDRSFTSSNYLPTDLNTPLDFSAANNIGNQKINNYSFNLDMEHPTKWANLNYGARISSIETNSNFEYYDLTNGTAVFDPTQSNQFVYTENTQALYFSAQKEWSAKWQAKLGLRLENTQTKGHSETLNEVHKMNYTKLFPTAYVLYIPNDNNNFTLSYSRRINRPGYSSLNPFRWIASAYSYQEGNPYLQPAFSDNIELEYVLKENFITSLYYSYTDNYFEELTIIDPETKIQQTIPENFIVGKMFGLSQTVILKPLKWWNVNLYGTVYYRDTDSKVPVTLQYLKGWNGEFSINNDFTLNQSKTLFFNIRYSYVTKGVDYLDYNSAFSQLNASFKGLFLDKKLTVTLYANDILSSSRITFTGYSNGLKSDFRNYYDNRYVTLSLAYNFGKAFRKENHSNKNNDDLNRAN